MASFSSLKQAGQACDSLCRKMAMEMTGASCHNGHVEFSHGSWLKSLPINKYLPLLILYHITRLCEKASLDMCHVLLHSHFVGTS